MKKVIPNEKLEISQRSFANYHNSENEWVRLPGGGFQSTVVEALKLESLESVLM